MSRARIRVTLVAAFALMAACSGGWSTSNPGSSAEGSAGGSAGIAPDTRPADPHESMDHSSMTGSPAPSEPAPSEPAPSEPAPSEPAPSEPAPSEPAVTAPAVDVLPGMPPVVDPHNIYSEAGANMLGENARTSKAYAYVPHSKSGDVWVIDAQTFQVVDRFHVGIEVQHVTPNWDMSALYATDDLGNVVRRIDPFTGRAGDTIDVFDPYNMYFTPDGTSAISVAEAYRSLVWYDPDTWQETDRVRYPDCKGIDHGDFTPDGRRAGRRDGRPDHQVADARRR